jgi:hypothetical protein
MSIQSGMTRRIVLAGGTSAILFGCTPPSNSGNQNQIPEQIFPASIPNWVENIPMYLSIASMAAPFGGALLGAIGLVKLAGTVKYIGNLANTGSKIADFISLANETRKVFFPEFSISSQPKPFITQAENGVNEFETIPILIDNIQLQLGVMNEKGGNFGGYDLFTSVKPVYAPPPKTYSEALGSGDLPSARISPAPNGSWDGKIVMGRLPTDAYVSYTWKVLKGEEPSDQNIASNAFVGPAFLSVASSENILDLQNAAYPNKNVEARFQVPDAALWNPD